MTLLAVAHVASAVRRYPGDALTFFTRVDALAALPGGFKIQMTLPAGLTVGSTRASANHGAGLADLVVVNEARYLYWVLDRPIAAGEQFEYVAETTVAPTPQDLNLESTAVVITTEAGVTVRVEETIEILVSAQGRYLRHLPALYQSDELMGRFLMLFESFLAPITQQVDQLHYYFDPKMTPPEALPWLARWVDLDLDERFLSLQQRRHLLSTAAAHYRKRGSKQGLVDMLEIYTGVTPLIIEHTARNFKLGPDTRMGSNIALGTSNQPHAFTVIIRLPAGHRLSTGQVRKDLERRLATLIESEKPAHTLYTLRLETAA